MTNDLISRSELMKYPIRINHYDEENGNCHFVFGIESVLEYAENLPAVDAAPVVHGRWIDNGIPESMLSGCSVCGFSCGAYTFNYCPNCGARMDEEEET